MHTGSALPRLVGCRLFKLSGWLCTLAVPCRGLWVVRGPRVQVPPAWVVVNLNDRSESRWQSQWTVALRPPRGLTRRALCLPCGQRSRSAREATVMQWPRHGTAPALARTNDLHSSPKRPCPAHTQSTSGAVVGQPCACADARRVLCDNTRRAIRSPARSCRCLKLSRNADSHGRVGRLSSCHA